MKKEKYKFNSVKKLNCKSSLVSKYTISKIQDKIKYIFQNKEIKYWKEQLRILSANPNIYCKLSGMLTEADYQQWTYDDIMPYMETAAEYFGFDAILISSPRLLSMCFLQICA